MNDIENTLKSGFDEATELLLQDILRIRKLEEVRDLVVRIMKLEFHDYRSQHKAPKVALVNALVEAGLDEVAENVPCGRYNQSKEEAIKCYSELLKKEFSKKAFKKEETNG